MFNRIRNAAENAAKTFNDLNEVPKQTASLTQLKDNARILNTKSPSVTDLVQPEDSPAPPPAEAPTATSAPATVPQGIPGLDLGDVDVESLPPIVKAKLRKFVKYEDKYPILLDAFKLEKKKSELIGIFEKVLKEYTPISSISDAEMLVDFIKGMNEKNKLLNDELKVQVLVNSGLKREKKNLVDEVKGLKAKVEELQKGPITPQVEKKEEKIEKSDNDDTKEKQYLERIDALEKSLTKEKETNESKIVELKAHIEESNNTIEALRSQNTELQLSIDGLNGKQADLEKLKFNQEKLDGIIVELAKKTNECQELEDKIKGLESEIDNLKASQNDPPVPVVEPVSAIEPKAEPTGQKGETSGKKKKNKKKKGKSTDSQVHTAAPASSSQTAPVVQESTTEQAASNDSQYAELLTSYETLKTDYKGKVEEVENLRELLKEIGQDLTESRTLIKELEVKAKKLDEAESTNGLNKQTIEKLNQDITNFKDEIAKMEEEAKKLKDQNNELRKQKTNDSSFKLQIESLKSSIEHKDKLIKEHALKITDLEKQLKDSSDSQKELKLLNGDLKNSNHDLLKAKNEAVTQQEFTTEKLNKTTSELNRTTSEKFKLKTELENLRRQYDSAMKEKSSSLNEYQLVKQQFEELNMRHKETSNRIESLEEELADSNRLLQDRTNETKSIKKILVDKDELLAARKQDHDAEIQSLKESHKEDCDELKSSIKRHERQIEELKSVNDAYSTKLEKLEKEMKTQTENHETQNETTEDPESRELVSTLRSSLQESSKKIREYENLNNVLKKLNEESGMKFERLSKNYKLLSQQYRNLETKKDVTAIPDVPPSRSRSESLEVDTKSLDPGKPDDTNIAYLKNVLLGFFEHRDQRDQLLPVLKTLFHFTAEDERKLLVALK